MKKLLLIVLCLNISICAQAQTETYTIDWSFGSNPSADGDANANRTIEEGDTVIWDWYATGTHNVVSEAGAAESFSSPLMGPGSTFSHTFTQVGTNDYVCTPHAGNMFGTITVVPEGTLSSSDFLLNDDVSLYPNPANTEIFVTIGNGVTEKLTLTLFNTLGQQIKTVEGDFSADTSVNVSDLNPGLYFVHLDNGTQSVTKKLIIQ